MNLKIQLFALAEVPFEDVRLNREKFMELKPSKCLVDEKCRTLQHFSVPLRPGAGFGGRRRADPAVGGYRSFSGKEIRLIFKNSKKNSQKKWNFCFNNLKFLKIQFFRLRGKDRSRAGARGRHLRSVEGLLRRNQALLLRQSRNLPARMGRSRRVFKMYFHPSENLMISQGYGLVLTLFRIF